MARDGERGRGDWKRLGSQNSGPYAEASGDTGPVDIAAVRRDDALIDAISGDGPVQTGTAEEYQLAALLANWRAEILEEPMPAGPDLDVIVAAVNQEIGARQARIGAQTSGRLRLVRPLLGAAAALALIIGGLTAFSYSAEPGDPLWRVKEVVFSEQAQTTVVARADTDLVEAQQLINQGRPEEAKVVMERASVNAGQVNDSDKKDDLLDRWQALFVQLQEKAPAVASSLVPVPSTSGKPTTVPAVTTNPNATIMLTPGPETGGGSTDPSSGGEVPPVTLPSTGGPIPTVPSTVPGTVPSNPGTVDPTQPSTAPTGGPITTSPASLPGTVPPEGQPPVTLPSVEKPPVVPATIPPPVNSLPTGGLVPTVPLVPGPS